MKKKLVAFAVTAAMVVTSAVPVFAEWGPAGQADWPEANAVVLDKDTLKGGITNEIEASITEGATYGVTVDLLKTSGNYVLSLDLRTNKDKIITTKAVFDNDQVWKGGVPGSHKTINTGITTFSWEVSEKAKKIFLNVDSLNTTTAVDTYLEWDLPTEAEEVVSVSVVNRDGYKAGAASDTTTIYQDQVPEYVTDVEVVKAEYVNGVNGMTGWIPDLDKYGRVQVVDQPVFGGKYVVNSITFNDGTEISNFVIKDGKVTGYTGDVGKYVNYNWAVTKRDGTEVKLENLSKNVHFEVNNDNYKGAYVTATVSGNKTSGIFGEATWGEDAESIAIQQRIAGADRYETAIKVADQMKPADGFTNIFVATGANYADALSVTALADKVGAPVLLVNGDYEEKVAQYIKDNAANYNANVYIVGGEKAVSADFETALKKFAVDVDRIAGADRYATNIAVLKAFDNKAPEGIGADGDMFDILVASGNNFPDALSAAATGKPVLLVGDALTKEQRNYIYEINSEAADQRNYTIIGGRNAVSDDVKDELSSKAYKAKSVTRIGGADRFETNMMVMEKFVENKGSAKYVFVATGNDYADALTGGALAAHNGAPLVLVNNSEIDPAKDIIEMVNTGSNSNYAGLVVIGGENAVSNELVQKIA